MGSSALHGGGSHADGSRGSRGNKPLGFATGQAPASGSPAPQHGTQRRWEQERTDCPLRADLACRIDSGTTRHDIGRSVSAGPNDALPDVASVPHHEPGARLDCGTGRGIHPEPQADASEALSRLELAAVACVAAAPKIGWPSTSSNRKSTERLPVPGNR
jgi:hypothetical protein